MLSFHVPPSLEAQRSNRKDFVARMLLIWVFPHENLAPKCLLPMRGCFLANLITSTFSSNVRNFRLTPRFPSCFLISRVFPAFSRVSAPVPLAVVCGGCSDDLELAETDVHFSDGHDSLWSLQARHTDTLWCAFQP